jgi:hypothetical protein
LPHTRFFQRESGAQPKPMTIALLNNVDHHDLRVITRHGEEFGEAVNQVLAFPTEFEELQREYPIVFRRDGEGALLPVALLGLSRDENLFLHPEGKWRARYVPALFQRGPFSIAAPDTPEGEPMIRVDLDHPRVSRSEGTPVFLPQGGNSAYLEQVSGVLRAIYVGHHLLGPMIAAFEAAGLLRQVNLEARVGESEVHAVTGVSIVDRERLAALAAGELAELHAGGFLQAAFFAAASLGNMQRLADLKGDRIAEAA